MVRDVMSSSSRGNFYEILNATSTSTLDELKSNYKQLILQCHPDKLQQNLELETNNMQTNDELNDLEFVAITEAWNCLKDSVKRKQYDAELLLNKFHTHNNIYAHVKLSEMIKQPNTNSTYNGEEGEQEPLHQLKMESVEDKESKYLYTYNCRCGGQYIVDESAEQYCRSDNNHETEINNDDDGDDDDADNKPVSSSLNQNKNKNIPNKNTACENKGDGGSSAAGAGAGCEGVVQDNGVGDGVVDEEGGGDLIVECSECSLVIILNG